MKLLPILSGFLVFCIVTGYTQGSGNTLLFDGDDNYISADAVCDLTNGQEISFSAWFYSDWDPSLFQNNAILAFNENSGSSINNVNLLYFNGPQGKVTYFDKNPANNNIGTNDTYPINHWLHVCLTIDQQLNGRIYVNGILQLTFDAYEVPEPGDRFSIGQEWDGFSTSAHFGGFIDEVRVWDYARSQEEIREDMCRKLSGNEPGLIGYFRMDEGAGVTLFDEVQQASIGSLEGFSPNDWTYSGAPIGDESEYLYPLNWTGQSLGSSWDSDYEIFIDNVQQNPRGVQLYKVSESPNETNGLPANPNQYFGVYGCDLNATYDLSLIKTTGTNCDTCELFNQVYARNDNAVLNWDLLAPTLLNDDCTALMEDESSIDYAYRSEYYPFRETAIISLSEEICEGDVFEIAGQSFTEAGQYSIETGDPSISCDTLILLDLGVNLTYDIQLDTFICEGDSFDGQSIFADTIFNYDYSTYQGCDSSITISVEVLEATEISITGGNFLCENKSITLGTFPEFATYEWSTGSEDAQIQITQAGTYTVTVTTTSGCSFEVNTQIELSEFDYDLFWLSPNCFGDSDGTISFDNFVGDGLPVQLSFNGNPPTSETTFENLSAGSYTWEITNSDGCKRSDSLELNNPAPLSILMPDTVLVELGTSYQLDPQFNFSPQSYQWEPAQWLHCTNCPTPESSPEENITYLLTAYDENGCLTSREITLILEVIPNMYIPNIFSPNDDGINDSFQLFPGGGFDSFLQFNVFDRWGELVFEQSGPAPLRWDGTFRGEKCDQGVYAWFAEIAFIDGQIIIFKGDVTLIR
ncbi:MAG: T9SS type B sorting domain-containing protein [Bacteroidetes bacterium]|nr:T9SS type B sorting domain-containing protein [Bacteroidota bacterium]